MNLKYYEIEIRGLVQGVGFRPYVFNLATEMKLRGYVNNDSNGVNICLEATENNKDLFIQRLCMEKPAVSEIEEIIVRESESHSAFQSFYIAASEETHLHITRVSPDIAVCDKCLADFKNQAHRINYPFVNCTHCGPRFSIIQSIPYDRPYTTMQAFEMCDTCRSEYTNTNDRRFHAQPIACNHCGPYYEICNNEQKVFGYNEIVRQAAKTLKQGGIVALKGIGGFNWLCDARNEDAIQRLRKLKHRYVKPFAIMCKSLDWAKEYQAVSQEEEAVLQSWRRPIVVLKEKVKISKEINGSLKTIGVMLPYLPIHIDLFDKSGLDSLVLTSANRPGEPMIISNQQACEFILPVSDLYIQHNREIHNRVDDSVVRVIDGKNQLLRRSRGYTPEPFDLDISVEGGMAMGAEITGMFAIGKSNQIILSQYIGDLTHLESFEAYKETIGRLSSLFRFKPGYLVADKHPDYFSSRLAEEMGKNLQIPVYKVQHHHAHAVSAMVEYNLSEECLAVTWDGTGYGDDGRIWGGELLRCDRTRYERVLHLPYVPLIGGDRAAKEPWRMALSYVWSVLDEEASLPEEFTDRIGAGKINTMKRIVKSGINQIETSSAGRLFDAVSSLLGLCDQNSYQAEAAMKLEHLGSIECDLNYYPIDLQNPWGLEPLLRGVLSDIENKRNPAEIARCFHLTCVEMIAQALLRECQSTGISKVIFTGGVFQNKLLVELLNKRLKDELLTVYYPTKIPCNDGGVPVGQLAAIAAALANNKLNKEKICMSYQLQ